MDWFTEYYNGCGLKIRVKEKIVERSEIQRIEIYQTESFGKMLVIDGKIQLTEFDEAFYHEMLVHIPMITHPKPKDVLIIGGGDGGAVREVLKHNPERIVVVEIDRNVVDLCKRYLRIDKGALDDDRVEIVIRDGKAFLEDSERFDVIIVDSTDPNPISSTLFDREFFDLASERCAVFCCQSQSPVVQRKYFTTVLRNSKAFKNRRVYVSYVPTYPLALWSFLIAGKRIETDIEKVKRRYKKRKLKTIYYNPEVHISAFNLPNWLKEVVKDVLNEGRGRNA